MKLNGKLHRQREFVRMHMGEVMARKLDCPPSVTPSDNKYVTSAVTSRRQKYQSLPLTYKNNKTKNDSKSSSSNLVQLALDSLFKPKLKKEPSKWQTITSTTSIIDSTQQSSKTTDHTINSESSDNKENMVENINNGNAHHHHLNNNNNNKNNNSSNDIKINKYKNDNSKNISSIIYQQQKQEESLLDFLEMHPPPPPSSSSSSNLLINSTHNKEHRQHCRQHHHVDNNTDHNWTTVPSPVSSTNIPITFISNHVNVQKNKSPYGSEKENTIIKLSGDDDLSVLLHSSHNNNNTTSIDKKSTNIYKYDPIKEHNKRGYNDDHRLPLKEADKNKLPSVTNKEKLKDPVKPILHDNNEIESNYPYAKTVRKKAERAHLPGTTCKCCIKYYEASTMMNVKEQVDRFSKHKVAYERPKTPPGFWDLDFPASPEKKKTNLHIYK
ncbi:unnamed protein product [Cunninghamella blakesleeana]